VCFDTDLVFQFSSGALALILALRQSLLYCIHYGARAITFVRIIAFCFFFLIEITVFSATIMHHVSFSSVHLLGFTMSDTVAPVSGAFLTLMPNICRCPIGPFFVSLCLRPRQFLVSSLFVFSYFCAMAQCVVIRMYRAARHLT
jgi:hypothetical protein